MKYILFLIFLNLSLYGQISASTHTILQDLSTPSACLNRKTEKVVLENGLQIYLISDPFVQQSAAAVVVETGFWDDPKEYPGMAHFVEHLLFMGTKTYPKESEYTQFIKDHGGVENAFTTTDKTVYAFSVHHEAYAQALDRFSHFFIDPLFSTSCISRELHAVEQEHAKNLENDWWRQNMVLKQTANPLHPHHHFSCGNQETLSKIPLAVLQDWYATHYSADRMHLVMLSSSSLSEMRDLAIAHFTPVVHVANKVEKKTFGSIFSDQQKASMIFINPVKDHKTLSLYWEIPASSAILDEKFPEFTAYVLKKEVKGSLLAKLKKENLAENLDVTLNRLSKDHFLFSIDVFLNEKSLLQKDAIISDVFAMLQCLKSELPNHLFEEFKTMQTRRYMYESMDDAFEKVMELASNILYEDLATYPTKTKLPSLFNAERFHKDFLHVLNPSDCVYFIMTDPDKIGVTLDQREQWMQVEYTIKPIDSKHLQAWKNIKINPEITLPEANPYLQALEDTPILIHQDDGAQVYFKRTHSSANGLAFQFKTPLLNQTSKAAVLIDLWSCALKDILADDLSFASDAGININWRHTPLDLTFEVCGSNEKVLLLTEKLFHSVKKVKISQEKFQTYITYLSDAYKNSSKELPMEQAKTELENIISNNPCDQQKLLALQNISYKDLLTFSEKFTQCLYMKAFLYVDLVESQATKLFHKLQAILKTKAYPVSQHAKSQMLVLSDLCKPSKLVLTTKQQGAGIVVLLQQGLFNLESRAVQKILSQALQNAFFETLRTQQQTAYIVESYGIEREKQLLQYFSIQSSTHTANDLLERFELFLKDFDKNLITEISLERFEQIRSSTITSLINIIKESYIGYQLDTQFMLAFDCQDFERIKKLIDTLNSLSYDRFCTIAHQMLSKDNPHRLAVLVEGEIPKKEESSYQVLSSRKDVQKLRKFLPKG